MNILCILLYSNSVYLALTTDVLQVVKKENFQKVFYSSLIFAQNLNCGYTLEPPNGSNEYPQSMFWSKNKQNRYTHEHVFLMIMVDI